MGNGLACICFTPGSAAVAAHRSSSSSGRPFIRIVHALDGRTCKLEKPMKVGELMLEFPNNFVAEYHQHLAAGKRVSPLPADQDTRAYHVYFLLPMHRLNTRLSAKELHHISTLACKSLSSATATSRAPGHSTKVTPLSAHHYEQAEKEHTLHESIVKSYSFPLPEEDAPQQQQLHHQVHYTTWRSRPWTPKLDTIVESAAVSV